MIRKPGNTPLRSTIHRAGRPKSVRVCAAQRAGASGTQLLEEVLNGAGFWRELNGIRGEIVIKPDLDFYDAGAHCGTDPALVEHLIDLLHDRGFSNVIVGDARNECDEWLHNRDPMVVPHFAGYRFVTPKDRPYEVVDIRGGETTHPRWKAAGYRINFAKNKTHEDFYFALCVHNLAGLAPTAGSIEGRCLCVLQEAPPHFNLIDAFVSAHGGAGHRAPRALATHTIIGSIDTLLADWAGAARMGLDPYLSPVNAVALRAVGLPVGHTIEGDLTPYPLWRNVHPLLARSARMRNQGGTVGRLSAAWFQTVNREQFPLRDFYSDRVNAFMAPLMTRVDENARSFWLAIALNYVIARIDGFVQIQNTLFFKDKLRRLVAPLLIDPAAFEAGAYEGIAAEFIPYERLLEHVPANAVGLRWRHVDGAVIFQCEHKFTLPFDRFIRRVDIARAIQYMNDYIGGSTVAVRRDRRGRIMHQAERNLYLQQPNWMVLLGGKVIDVEKIECITYARGLRAIHWRTVASPNDSALVDDGCVAFNRTAEGQTHVRIFARQQFALPPAFGIVDVDLAPAVRDAIIDRAYTTFFINTIDNLQKAYDGIDFRIGRESSHESPERAVPRFLATAAAALAEMLNQRAGNVGDVSAWMLRTGSGPTREGEANAPPNTDEMGFRHFSTPPRDGTGPEDQWIAGLAALARDAPDFVRGLADAVHHDLDHLANPEGRG